MLDAEIGINADVARQIGPVRPVSTARPYVGYSERMNSTANYPCLMPLMMAFAYVDRFTLNVRERLFSP